MFALQRESQAYNLQLLALQEQVQDESRRFGALTYRLTYPESVYCAEIVLADCCWLRYKAPLRAQFSTAME